MGFAGGGAKGRDRVMNAMLRQSDDVHVALYNHNALQPAWMLAGLPEAVEFPGLLEYRRLGRIQILGLVVAQHSAAKGNDPAALILNGEHHPLAKTIIGATLIVFDQHAGSHEYILSRLISAVGLHEVVPTCGRKADAEIPGDLAGKAPTL